IRYSLRWVDARVLMRANISTYFEAGLCSRIGSSRRHSMRFVRAITLLVLASTVFAQEPAHHHALAASELGSVNFKTSCAAAVQTPFNRAVALLHSFEYDEARSAFESVARQDPTCAMAYWGVAMTRLHGLWSEFNAPAGKAAV